MRFYLSLPFLLVALVLGFTGIFIYYLAFLAETCADLIRPEGKVNRAIKFFDK
jgi:hypothetical protein